METPPFRFDQSLSAQENIERFYAHMATIDPNQTKLLKDHIGKMIPLQDAGDRGTQRAAFIKEILKDLDTVE